MVQPAPCVIEPHYHQVRILHKHKDKTRHVIARIPGSAPPAAPVEGAVYLEAELPPPDSKHAALGRFMDTWSKLELQLRLKLQEVILSAYPPAAEAVSYSVSGKALMELLFNLASVHLSSKDRAEYLTLGERFEKLNTKRNYLVHGWWTLELVVYLESDEPRVRAVEVREYPPSDPEQREALNDLRNQSARGRYLFDVERIGQTEKDVAALYKAFTAFHNAKLTRRR